VSGHEARFGQPGTIRRVWAPKGSRPRRVRQAGYTFPFVLVAVGASTGDASTLIMPEWNAAVLNRFLGRCTREWPAGVHVVWIGDGAGYHVSAKLVVPSHVSLIPRPPNSPELNPVENLWHFLRTRHGSNRPYRSDKDLEDEAVRSMRRVCLDDKESLKNICNAPYIPALSQKTGRPRDGLALNGAFQMRRLSPHALWM
jgi:DDE superfamily endonuclease